MRNHIVSVVGGSGFLGRYVVHALADAGYTVRVLTRHPSQAEFLRPAGDVGQIVPDYADITKPDTLRKKLKGSYAVVNLVGVLAESGRQTFQNVQAEGAKQLAESAKEAGVKRFVQVSALGIDHALPSRYARSKRLGEDAVLSMYPDAIIMRPSIIFGAEDEFFNKFARMAILSPALPLIGDGKTKFQPVYVDDVAHAITATLQDPAAKGIYELGGPDVYRFEELMEYILRVTKRNRLLVHIPFPAASLIGRFTSLLPNPPLTADQVRLLKYDNVVSGEYPGLDALGIVPQTVDMIVPQYLAHWRAKNATDIAA
ncbi:MAG: complex I NDUFA9 subunit family protein [Rickettsiales bacterium]|nr:complex I NDUFA9 subunit family protein [Rickettsiales bacterium]